MLKPIGQKDWNDAAAAHLLSRAGFGGTPAEIVRLAALRPEQAVRELLRFPTDAASVAPPSWIKPGAEARPDPRSLKELPAAERRQRFKAARELQQMHMQELRRWWLERMLGSSYPLQEKLSLFWHGHFTSGMRKVRSAYALYRQNTTFRRLGAGNWRTLLGEAAREPAMLLYLDNAQSHAKAPNENFARELMELFTLGEGNYTETDVQEAARAFTGWTLEPGAYAFANRPMRHDNGEKSILGQRGNFDGDAVLDMIVAQPAAAEWITRKLWTFFAYADPEPELVQALASILRRKQYALAPVLDTMFLSAEFYGPRCVRTQVKSPVAWLVGMLKTMEMELPPGPRAPQALRSLGQDLFEPPNVKGWDGGIAWINAASLVKRYNVAAAVVTGRGGGGGALPGMDAARMLPERERATRQRACSYLRQRVFQGPLDAADVRTLDAYVAAWPEPDQWTEAQVRDVVRHMVATPLYQVT